MKKLFSLVLPLLLTTTTYADHVNKIVFFGDSLTDNGNLYQVLAFPKSPPYFSGRFSNGFVWADDVGFDLQAKYQMDAANFAVGGATSILRNPFEGYLPWTMSEEIILTYSTKSTVDERMNSLFVIWIGANDYLNVKNQTVEQLTDDVVNQTVNDVKTLISMGGRHFVLMDLPDLSKTPRGIKNVEDAPRWHDISVMHRDKIIKAVQDLKTQYPDLFFSSISTYDAFNDILDHTDKYEQYYQLHITNKTGSCWTGGYTLNAQWMKNHYSRAENNYIMNSPSLKEAAQVAAWQEAGVEPCNNPDEYLFWDSVHPTQVTHKIMAYVVEEALKAEEKNGLILGGN